MPCEICAFSVALRPQSYLLSGKTTTRVRSDPRTSGRISLPTSESPLKAKTPQLLSSQWSSQPSG